MFNRVQYHSEQYITAELCIIEYSTVQYSRVEYNSRYGCHVTLRIDWAVGSGGQWFGLGALH